MPARIQHELYPWSHADAPGAAAPRGQSEVMSNELDILIVGFHEERFSKAIRTSFRHWQVYSAATPHAVYGRRFRRVYVTGGAFMHHNWATIYDHLKAR